MTNDPTAGTAERGSGGEGRGGSGRMLWAALALLGGIYLLVWARYQPPAPRPASAPAGQFSAVRAEAMLRPILGDEQPHPVGSAADARVREAIVSRLKRLGYQPEVRQAFACSTDGVCGEVRNVLARLDGSEGGKAVLVAAHYDSVPAGPGASDDGAGIAAELEMARALKAGPAPRHPVIFLFDEGEEAGLLGAVAFVEQNVWAREVGAAVNLEARGTSGPSLMFETGSHSLWLMPLFARAVPRPLANSLYYAVYRRLPNDTDFSIFKKHGFDGFNFAFIGDVTHYHTPLDNLSHFDTRSLQSQGAHALGVVRALANAKLGAPTPGGAVFFDVAAWRMVWWPAGWSPWLAGIAMALLLACVWVLLRRGRLTAAALGKGLLAWPAVLVVASALAVGLRMALRTVGSVPSGWVAYPAALVAAFLMLGLSVAFGAAAWIGERAGFQGFWCGTWLWWAALAMGSALATPETSFPWLIPALVAGIVGLDAVLFEARGWKQAAALLPALAAALLVFEIGPMLYSSVGSAGLPIAATFFAALGTTLAPLIVATPRGTRRAVVVGFAGVTVILAVIAAILPPYISASPQRATYEFVQDAGTGRARWLLATESGKLPPGVATTGAFSGRTKKPFPWVRLGVPAFVGEAKAVDDAGPELEVLDERNEGGRIEVQARITSSRGAPVVALYFPPRVHVESFAMQGQKLPALSRRVLRATNGWQRFVCVTTPAAGVDVSFAVKAGKGFRAVVLDESYGLPPEGEKLLRARPENAVASQSGDVTVFVRTITIGRAHAAAQHMGI